MECQLTVNGVSLNCHSLANALPLCHCKVTVSLKIHLNQVSPNRYQSMPIDCQLVNAMPLEPLLCHFNHWDATQGESHSIGPSLMPMDCQLVNAMPLGPLLCHFNHWDATQGESHSIGPSLYSTASTQGQGPRSFPSIEENIRGPCP